MPQVLAMETPRRGNGRRTTGMAKLETAVAAILGGVLRAWDHQTTPRAVWRSSQAAGFTGAAVGRRGFAVVMRALLAHGLLAKRRGHHPAVEASYIIVEPKGCSARCWPRPALLDLAERHGMRVGEVEAHFVFVAPPVVPRTRERVELRPLAARNWKGGRRPLWRVGSRTDPEAEAMATEVAAQNALAARTRVAGCAPPRWTRLFLGSWELHGRWYAAGDGAYLQLSAAARARLLIDGGAVVELDVRASHLTIVRSLAGQGMFGAPVVPDGDAGGDRGDPYAVAGLPREVAKQWVLEALGLAPRELVVHAIMALEAAAMTRAMRDLRAADILALPVHDSLIVPAEAEAIARRAIVAGYEAICGATPCVR